MELVLAQVAVVRRDGAAAGAGGAGGVEPRRGGEAPMGVGERGGSRRGAGEAGGVGAAAAEGGGEGRSRRRCDRHWRELREIGRAHV